MRIWLDTHNAILYTDKRKQHAIYYLTLSQAHIDAHVSCTMNTDHTLPAVLCSVYITVDDSILTPILTTYMCTCLKQANTLTGDDQSRVNQ